MIPPIQINKANKFPITAILDFFGHSAALERSNGELVYFSPFREEKTPSFYVNPKKNVFKDFGDDKAGDAISLYRYLTGKSFITAVYELIENKINISTSTNIEYKPIKENDKTLEIITIREEISNPRLVMYAESRGISIWVLNTFCSEITYRQKNGKIYSSIGFKNDNGGFELRSAGFKACYGTKSITTITGNDEVLVFEGFFDFLSFCQMHTCLKGRSAIVLNSLSLLKTIPYKNYSKVFHFLNNDDSGEKAKKRIAMYHHNTKDWSSLYFAYNDLNERLQALARRENEQQKQAI